jgi:SAM-dependent methyltransferase
MLWLCDAVLFPYSALVSETDWEARYQSGDMPWEKGDPSPGLVDFLSSHGELPRGTALVPGCGTGHDVRAWARAGFAATGLDLAPSAIRLAQERTAAARLSAQFILGSFLDEPPKQQFDWIFEHTLYCAIDPTCRDDYVRAVLRWLKPNGQFLAVHYMIRDSDGPPFGCTQPELMERFSPHFQLRQGWVPHSYPNRAGLELMLWWIRQRGGLIAHSPVCGKNARSEKFTVAVAFRAVIPDNYALKKIELWPNRMTN